MPLFPSPPLIPLQHLRYRMYELLSAAVKLFELVLGSNNLNGASGLITQFTMM